VNRGRRSILPWIYAGSVAAHAAFAAITLALPAAKSNEAVAIELAEIKKKNEPPKPPPPPPPPPPKEEKPKPPPPRPAAAAQAKVAVEPAKAADLPPVEMGADGFADLGGVSLGGATGDGIAAGPSPAAVAAAVARSAAAPKATARKVEALAPAVAATTCNESVVRPKRKAIVSPTYTMQARQAEIEGVVKVEVTVDEHGKAIATKVTTSLGYGLDDSAVKAALETPFEPSTLCGRAVVGRVILVFRFQAT
jgi:protein TonB